MERARAQITLVCPICRSREDGQQALALSSSGSWQCPMGHHFDQAKQGYLNLLPAQFKRSKDPGDSKLMVQARRRFLEGGHYAPIVGQLAKQIEIHAGEDFAPLRILDAGCGEGYYLRRLAEVLPDDYQWFGNDVSKPAVQAAASWHKAGHYVVASNARLPYPDASFDLLICGFGFSAESKFLRVLKPQGAVITIDPLAAHLQALRDVLYEQDKTRSGHNQPQLNGFRLAGESVVKFGFDLQQAELQDLLAMTPHAHRAPPSGKQRLAALDVLELEAVVAVRYWQVETHHEKNKEIR